MKLVSVIFLLASGLFGFMGYTAENPWHAFTCYIWAAVFGLAGADLVIFCVQHWKLKREASHDQ